MKPNASAKKKPISVSEAIQMFQSSLCLLGAHGSHSSSTGAQVVGAPTHSLYIRSPGRVSSAIAVQDSSGVLIKLRLFKRSHTPGLK